MIINFSWKKQLNGVQKSLECLYAHSCDIKHRDWVDKEIPGWNAGYKLVRNENNRWNVFCIGGLIPEKKL